MATCSDNNLHHLGSSSITPKSNGSFNDENNNKNNANESKTFYHLGSSLGQFNDGTELNKELNSSNEKPSNDMIPSSKSNNINSNEIEEFSSSSSSLYSSSTSNVNAHLSSNELNNTNGSNNKNGAGPIIMLFSILFGLYFCRDNKYNNYTISNYSNNNNTFNLVYHFSNGTNKVDDISNNNSTLFYFIFITVIEVMMNIILNIIFTTFLKNNRKIVDFLNICRVLLICLLFYKLQIICGINCPVYIIVTYRIIVVANIFYYSRFLFGICVISLIITSVTSYLHAICNFYNLNFITLFCQIFIEQNNYDSINNNYNNCNLEYYNNKLFEIIFLETAVGVVSWFFGVAISKQKDLNIIQKIEIENEKILSSAKTKFIGNLSHEARNNLNCLIGAIHLLRSYQKVDNNVNNKDENNCKDKKNIHCSHCIITNPSINELIQDISDNANLLLKIFTRSLQMSTLELGDVKLNIQPFNLLSLFESMISVYSPLANEKGVSLHSFFNFTKVPIYLLGDHVRISQIFMNIISNAIKYTNKNGCVTVTCNLANEPEIKEVLDRQNSLHNNNEEKSNNNKEEDLLTDEDYHFVKIECKDTGKGISEKGLNELFTPFHTLDDKTQQQSTTTTTNTQTTFDRYFSQSEQLKDNNVSVLLLQNRHGLGLSICKVLIERMNGTISVKSKVNEGTTMTIVLPLKKVEVDNNRGYNISKIKNNKDNDIGVNHEDTVNDTNFDNVIQITMEEQKFNELEKLSLKVTKKKYLLNIILMDNDKYFKECISSYFNSFATIINHQLITCNDINEIENNSSKDEDKLNVKYIIICGEEQFYNIQEKLKLIINNKEINYQIVPTTLRSSPRKEKCFYLTKPIKLLDILEFLLEQLREFLPKEQNLYRKMKEKVNYNTSSNTLINETNLKLLEIIGFTEIDTASNGLECFEKFKQKKYSIILLDCLMPVLNGIQSCEMIRNYEKDCNLERTTIIAITANIFESKESLIEKGFTSVLYKPITLSTLKQEIKLFIEDIK
ncbi:hypothetical protein ABK040_013308 [Willaertia magna]